MHLINYLDDLNEAHWVELYAYMTLTGVEIPPGECRIIIRLGQEQINMLHEAEEPDYPAPYVSEIMIDAEKSAQITASFIARFK